MSASGQHAPLWLCKEAKKLWLCTHPAHGGAHFCRLQVSSYDGAASQWNLHPLTIYMGVLRQYELLTSGRASTC